MPTSPRTLDTTETSLRATAAIEGKAERSLLRRVWDLLQAATRAPDDQILIGIEEVPASQAMEMGEIMPDVV